MILENYEQQGTNRDHKNVSAPPYENPGCATESIQRYLRDDQASRDHTNPTNRLVVCIIQSSPLSD